MRPVQSDSQFYASFTDLLALLLVFFIYLTAMNSMTVVSNVTQTLPLLKSDFAPIELVDDYKDLKALILKVEKHVLFGLGSSELTDSSKPLLDELAAIVIKKPVKLIISGHTDPRPIQRPIIESNWHLSALRAASVANYLDLKGVPTDYLQIAGYADTVLEANSNDGLNRRVEIRLEQL